MNPNAFHYRLACWGSFLTPTFYEDCVVNPLTLCFFAHIFIVVFSYQTPGLFFHSVIKSCPGFLLFVRSTQRAVTTFYPFRPVVPVTSNCMRVNVASNLVKKYPFYKDGLSIANHGWARVLLTTR
jgi:hypothetical protein